ncbi:hypothetical protein THRCLA_23128 [Thraustotheca clavata]|uniref:Helicase-associated domain-containing protein n=1 Tax=Thraustotheca clavata TaxID=74557 RepID=A0A1V9YDC0_9STRA|nr:hypothetical protein THRCLA_23128 [Thraustotheca clavata]
MYALAVTNYKLGFVWDGLECKWQHKLAALTTYKKLYGDLLIPQKFVVPTNDPQWPECTWQSNLTPERRNALERLGFVCNVLDHSWQNKFEALKVYKSIYSNANVPYSFVVPTNDQRWPKHLHNMPLGRLVRYLRYGSYNEER